MFVHHRSHSFPYLDFLYHLDSVLWEYQILFFKWQQHIYFFGYFVQRWLLHWCSVLHCILRENQKIDEQTTKEPTINVVHLHYRADNMISQKHRLHVILYGKWCCKCHNMLCITTTMFGRYVSQRYRSSEQVFRSNELRARGQLTHNIWVVMLLQSTHCRAVSHNRLFDVHRRNACNYFNYVFGMDKTLNYNYS